MIPQKSEASVKNGMWFIHNDETNVIQVWGSSLSGKEKVFLDGELVSEQRRMKRLSVHKFKDMSDHDYEVIIETKSMIKGTLECTIKKENTILKVFNTRYIKGKRNGLKRYLVIILASAIYAFISILLNLPDSTFYIFLAIVLVVNFKTSDHGEIVIEEV